MPKAKKSKNKPSSRDSVFNMNISFGGVNINDKAIFARNLSVMLKSGLTISDALIIAADSARGKFRRILKSISKSVAAGQGLSDSLARHPKVFSGLFINATRAGEASGTLEENLENVAQQINKERELVSKIKSAMLYPVVVLVAAFILAMAVSFFILPKITPLFFGLKMELPVTTRALIYLSGLIESQGITLFLGIIIFVIFFLWLIKQKFSHPITHWLLLNVPIIKRISKNANLSSFCLALGVLLRSGINIDEAIEITEQSMGNYYYRRALSQVSKSISKGSTLSENLSQFENLFPIIVVKMIDVGEKSGNLEETLIYLSGFYEAEVDNATKSLTIVIEPILLIIIGIVVGLLALSIITPIYNITGGIRR